MGYQNIFSGTFYANGRNLIMSKSQDQNLFDLMAQMSVKGSPPPDIIPPNSMPRIPLRPKPTPVGSAQPATARFPRLETSNSMALSNLYISNKAELTRQVSTAAGAHERLYGADSWYLRWWETPLNNYQKYPDSFDDDSHNLIEHQKIPDEHLREVVEMMVQQFEPQGRRFSWVTGPMDQPQLETLLRNRSFFRYDSQPAMVADLTTWKDPQSSVEEYQRELARYKQREREAVMLERKKQEREIKQRHLEAMEAAKLGITPEKPKEFSNESSARSTNHGSALEHTGSGSLAKSTAGPSKLSVMAGSRDPTFKLSDYHIALIDDVSLVAEWVRAWAHEAADSAAGVAHWTRIYERVFNTLPASQFQMYVVRSNNASQSPVVGTGYVHFYDGVAAIHCVVVRPEFRKMGCGQMLMHYGMRLATERGYNMVMATGTTSGMHMFRKLGFKDIGRVKLFTYLPCTRRPANRLSSTNETDLVKQEVKPTKEEDEEDDWEMVEG
ncbi:hypothetical protein F5Y15DRAFT_396053 [Xylariaceae sp. FL0016]|nr:hypothetical protein F5Y15DRAFT_396053 [Xylariaceae sp. FL0016]